MITFSAIKKSKKGGPRKQYNPNKICSLEATIAREKNSKECG